MSTISFLESQVMRPYDFKRAFGERLSREHRLKQVRDDREILKQDIAKALGVSVSVIGRWLAGLAMPTDDLIMTKLARYFGVTPAWLRYGQEPREPPPDTKVGDTERDPRVTPRRPRKEA